MSRIHPTEIHSSGEEDFEYTISSPGARNSSSIIRPFPKQKQSINTVNPIEYDPQLFAGSYSVNFEEELARLELETSDNFVYDALGSYQINPSETPETIDLRGVETLGTREKYTVRSAKVRDSADYHRHIRRGGRLNFDEQSSDLSNVKNNGDSGISSANTPRNVVDKLAYSEEPEEFQELDMGNDSERQRKTLEKKPSKTQINGSVGGISGENAAGTSSRRQQNSKPKFLPSQPSVYAQTDANILRSDLLAAVEQNKVDRVRRILNSGNGVDPNSVCDDKGRWPLHLACLLGHHAIAKLLLEHGSQKDQPDTTLERTPLMYAAATSKETTQILLGARADLSARNRFGATALHYAAGAGQADCCRLLASAGIDINGRDRQKMTPLLMAARVNDIWSIEILLEYGADVHALDMFGKSALHHAAETCEGTESDSGKMGATFRKLVSAGITINAIDVNGRSALSYAIQTGSAEAVTILYELGAELIDGLSLLTMSKKFPALIPNFLDKCVSSNIDNCDPESKQFYIQFDYTCLTFFPKDIHNDKLLNIQNRVETEGILQEMGVLHGLTKCSDSSILSHPVCESLLRLKWKKVKWYLYLDMLLFAVFLAFLTAVIFMEYESDTTMLDPSLNSTDIIPEEYLYKETPTHHSMGHERYCMDSTRNIVVWSILWVLTAFLFIREMVQLIQSPLHYVVQVDNMLELVLVSSVALLSLAECGVQSFVEARDHFAAVCLIVGWTIQVTLYGKIPVFGVYIRMFAAVAVNILKCMFTYLGLLFAFSLTLHFLFRTQKDFDSVGFTFLKTFAMMIGEVDLARTFIDSKLKNAVIVPFTSHLVVALFIIFISIILSSLFIALAVCDISSMQREGEYMQLVQQVKVSSQLEDALQKRSLLYPQFGMRDIRSLRQRKGVIFPNLKDHGKLSKDALEIVMTQHTKRLDPSRNKPTHADNDHTTITNKATNEIVEDLVKRLKDGMDKYSQDVDKKVVQMVQDMRSNDRGSSSLAREVLLIKGQLEDMNKCLREMSVVIRNISDRSSLEMSPVHSRKKSSRTSSRSMQNQDSPSPIGIRQSTTAVPIEENQTSSTASYPKSVDEISQLVPSSEEASQNPNMAAMNAIQTSDVSPVDPTQRSNIQQSEQTQQGSLTSEVNPTSADSVQSQVSMDQATADSQTSLKNTPKPND